MGGNFVYPGGRVDPDDGHPEICPHCRGVTPGEARRILGETISELESFAHWTAGIRELFEEANVLLAYDRGGNPLTGKDPFAKELLLKCRNLLQKGKVPLLELAQEEGLLFALDQLHYYAHWITPEARSERFDTRFFLALHPQGQEAIHDQKETTEGLWLTPREALGKNLTGDVLLSPPTLKTLEDLSRFDSIGKIFNSLPKTRIQPILPILTKVSGETFIIFPWDLEYETFRKGELPDPIDHGRPSGPDDNTTRVVFREGRWLPYCRTE
jgi:8-oxo-dGTP pyrophosphatase MutT (NUDIX family)